MKNIAFCRQKKNAKQKNKKKKNNKRKKITQVLFCLFFNLEIRNRGHD